MTSAHVSDGYTRGRVDYGDLREWMELVRKDDDLRLVEGASWDLEIGTITDLYQRRMGLPALLFDRIEGYQPGYRVLSNSLTSLRRIARTLGLSPSSTALDLIAYWRTFARGWPRVAPRTVPDGPVNERVLRGDEVDIDRFPTPRWHHLDGGRYIGTGCLVIQRDPDDGWVNVGVYRVMAHDRRHVGLYISPGKHGRMILEKLWGRGEPCPVAISVGHDPLIFLAAGLEIPRGVCEYEVAGGLRGEPVEVIDSDVTGLPIPARSEAVIEGYLHPGELREEGPFGEWLGYYAGGARQAPVVRVEAVRHRADPILLGNLPSRPPNDDTYYRGILRAAMVWEELEAAGVPGVRGVWAHDAGGGRMWLTVAIEQLFPGHPRQAGLIAGQCRSGAYANRYVVVVDADIDVTNTDEVIWALCSRVDVRHDLQRIDDAWSTPLDPMSYPSDHRTHNARLVIDACRPWNRRDTFPSVASAPPDLRRAAADKWRQVLPEIDD
ncbi:MAG: UbiD family decarboxylase [Nocardioidaceae bacterium]